MKLIFGLGNPGEKYKKNRHNAGFIILDELKKTWNFPDFEFSKKFDAESSEADKDKEKIIFVKPQTFMNNSGETVRKMMDFYKLTPDDITVIHDDLDIALGEFRISADSRAAGHNGVQNIIDKLGTKNFKRIRIGIEGEEARKNRTIPGDVFVLQDFSDEELEIIRDLVKKFF